MQFLLWEPFFSNLLVAILATTIVEVIKWLLTLASERVKPFAKKLNERFKSFTKMNLLTLGGRRKVFQS